MKTIYKILLAIFILLSLISLGILVWYLFFHKQRDNYDTMKNILGKPLEKCTNNTGFYRDGFCRTGPGDTGKHVVCATMTDEFLDYTKNKGNDLITPHPPSFPGLKKGDKWCLCASRWDQAYEAGLAPPVDLSATSESVLRYVDKGRLV